MINNTHGLRHNSQCASSRHAQSGYSIFDLIVTSTVAGVLSLGAVGATGVVQDARLTAELNELMVHLNLARSEAIKRRTAVTICKSEDGTGCASGSEWGKGWIVFVDDNINHQIDDGEVLIRIEQPLEAVKLNFAGALNHDSYLTYKPDGKAEPNGTFTFCDNRGANKAKAIILLGTGRPRVLSLIPIMDR